ncbi:MAG TPA: helical backbone metal receptor [Candidatus Limnocylindrales bacterium]
MRLSRPLAWLVAVLVTVLAACSGTTPSGSAGPTAGSAEPSLPFESTAPSPSPIAYPLTLTDDEGTAVTIPAAPKTIVSLTPATTETIFAIGAGPALAGRTDADDYPAQASAVNVVVKLGRVDVEQVVGLSPDLVLAGGNGFTPPDVVAQLRALRIPVVVVYAKDVGGVLADIRLVGQAAGHIGPADDLADSMSQQIAAIRAATDGIDRPSVFYEIDATSAIYTAADQSFLAEMLAIAGGEPVTTGSTTAYDIPLEKLVAADPAIILLGDAAYGVTPDLVAARPGWGTIAAVKARRIIAVDDVVITRPGPRLVQGLVDLVRAIHPELGIEPLDAGAPPEASPAPAAS